MYSQVFSTVVVTLRNDLAESIVGQKPSHTETPGKNRYRHSIVPLPMPVEKLRAIISIKWPWPVDLQKRVKIVWINVFSGSQRVFQRDLVLPFLETLFFCVFEGIYDLLFCLLQEVLSKFCHFLNGEPFFPGLLQKYAE